MLLMLSCLFDINDNNFNTGIIIVDITELPLCWVSTLLRHMYANSSFVCQACMKDFVLQEKSASHTNQQNRVNLKNEKNRSIKRESRWPMYLLLPTIMHRLNVFHHDL